jgi:hypothetical protein
MRSLALLLGLLLAAPLPAFARDVVVVLGPSSSSTDAMVDALEERGFVDETAAVASQRLPVAAAGAPPQISDRLAEIREQFYDADFSDTADGALELIEQWEADPASFAIDSELANEALEVVLMGVRALETRDKPDEAAALLLRLAARARFALPDPSRVSDTQSLQLQSAQASLSRRSLDLLGATELCTVFVDGFAVELPAALPTHDATLTVVCASQPRMSQLIEAGDAPVVRWVVAEPPLLSELLPQAVEQLGADRLLLVAASEAGVELAAWGVGATAATIDAGGEASWVSGQLDPAPPEELPLDVETAPRRSNAAGWTLGALALGTAGAGAWLETRVAAGRDAVDSCADRDACVLDGTIVDERRDLRLVRAGATAAWAAAGALAAGALLTAMVDGRDGRVALAPTFGPNSFGVSFTSHLRER